jgi:hypothetical protein
MVVPPFNISKRLHIIPYQTLKQNTTATNMATGDHDISIGPHLFQESSPFFQLPQEIRDLVYDNLFTNTRFVNWIVSRKGRQRYRAQYLYPPPNHLYKWKSTEPVWLLACKQIFFEARQQYFRKACCGRIRDTKPGTTKSIDNLTFFSLQHVRTLDFSHLPVIFEQPTARQRYRFMTSLLFFPLPNINASFQKLRMTFRISTIPPRSLDKGEGLGYSLFNFEQIRDMTFDRVEFIIEQPTIGHISQINEVVEIYSLLQRQLIDSAKILTDGHSKSTTFHDEGWSVRDWIEEEVKIDLRGNPNRKIDVQYSWHVEVRKKTRDQSHDGLIYGGLRHFIACLFKKKIGVPPDRHHFHRIESSDLETTSFYCVETAKTLRIKGNAVNRK